MWGRFQVGALILLCAVMSPPLSIPAPTPGQSQDAAPTVLPKSEFESIEGGTYQLEVVEKPAAEGHPRERLLLLRRDFKTETLSVSIPVPLREGVRAEDIVSVKLAEWSSRNLVGAFAVRKGVGRDYFVVLIAAPEDPEPHLETHPIYESPTPMEIVGVNGRYRLGSVLITLAATSLGHQGLDFDESVFIFNGCPWHWSRDATVVRTMKK